MFKDLRQFLGALYKQGEIVDVFHEVDSDLEIAEIHRQVAASNGPALFFHNVKNSPFPVCTNLFGTKKRVEIAFSNRPEEKIGKLVHLLTEKFPPSLSTLWENRSLLKSLLKVGTNKVKRAPILQNRLSPLDLEKLPLLKTWPQDGGSFITLPLVYTEPPGGGPPNLGMYRIQRYNKHQTGLHFQIGKGGGFHYHKAEQEGKALPVTISVGGSPSLILSAITPLPENVPELLVASLLEGSKLSMATTEDSPYPLFGEAEFVLVGEAKPFERALEGPFGDHYGYYSLAHEFPIFDCKAVYHRNNAIYPATVVGKPIQEDFYIGNYLQKLLSPLFPVVMPGVLSLWSYGEAGFHALASAVVKERFAREAMQTAFRILGEGQLSFTKSLLLTDQNVDLEDFKTLLTTILERVMPERDLFIISNLSLDTLDYTGPKLNHGSRLILLGMGEKVRSLPREYKSGPLPHVRGIEVFSPGCLCIETDLKDPAPLLDRLKEWPLVVIVDDLKKSLSSTAAFLWTTFTRFDPGSDVYAPISKVERHHLCYTFPIMIDARMKPSYPEEVLPSAETKALVQKNWENYFPQGMERGDSDRAHVC